jgi:hypothetical protein
MSRSKSTRQQLVKVPQVSCLYRHSLSGIYYGIKKVGGKRKEHSLSTSDRKLAERRLKKWIADLGKTDAAVEHLTLRELIRKLQRAHEGKAPKTRATEASIIRKLEQSWPHDLDMRVGDIRPSHRKLLWQGPSIQRHVRKSNWQFCPSERQIRAG